MLFIQRRNGVNYFEFKDITIWFKGIEIWCELSLKMIWLEYLRYSVKRGITIFFSKYLDCTQLTLRIEYLIIPDVFVAYLLINL